jgi:hypothetical protein
MKLDLPNLTPNQVLSYEVVRSYWWSSRVSNPFLQELYGRYFAWKTRRILRRISDYRLKAH